MLRSLILLSALALTAQAAFTWDSCGTKLDRLKTSKLSVAGSLSAGSKVTVTASGATDLHVPLTTGAWQVRIYETGVAKSTHTEVGDLMKALKFDDPKNTTFTMTVSFTLPAKQASGKFDANLVAVDQSKADYLCLDVKYAYGAARVEHIGVEAVEATTTLYTLQTPPDCGQVDIPSQYAKQAMAFDKNLKEGTCASVGYTVADGTVTKKVPVLGTLTIKKFKKATLQAAGTNMWIRHSTHLPTPIDPTHSHCDDVSVDMDDNHAKEWYGANNYKYKDWQTGLCDSTAYPSVESVTHPGTAPKVTLRKLGHGKEDGWTPKSLFMAAAGKTVDCRSDKTTDPIKISFDNAAGSFAKIRGCQNQYACKPYQDCELNMADSSTESVVIDASFKYMVFTYKGACAGNETELYPDANMHWPATYTIKCPKTEVTMLAEENVSEDTLVINSPSPGSHAHCEELSFAGGKNNAYWKAHGYQYTPPVWNMGPCAKKYNWFNKNQTIAPGVTETTLGIHL